MPPEPEGPALEPGVYLVGTPIGNMEDITLRALRVLAGADVLACEDTRITRKLFQRHGIPAPKTLLVCNDNNERAVSRRLAALAAEGKVVAFCSDAGLPGLSDPGYHIAAAAREAGVRLEAAPGPVAAPTALVMSGLPTDSFTFLGFPPRRGGKLRGLLRIHGGLRPTLVLYESPKRLGRLLALAAETLGGDRRAAVCLELTKKFERVLRGGLAELAARFAGADTRGEATVVIEGVGKGRTDDEADDEASGEAEDDDAVCRA